MKRLLFLLLFLSLLGCKKSLQKKKVVSKTKSAFSIPKSYTKFVTLSSLATSKVVRWKEYQSLKEVVGRFQNISPNGALANALELDKVVRKLKDSIRPQILKTPAFKARVNVLENEALRLSDMTYIPAITADDIIDEVAKILMVYSSMNQKINAVYSLENFEKTVSIESISSRLDTLKTPSFYNKKATVEPLERKE